MELDGFRSHYALPLILLNSVGCFLQGIVPSSELKHLLSHAQPCYFENLNRATGFDLGKYSVWKCTRQFCCSWQVAMLNSAGKAELCPDLSLTGLSCRYVNCQVDYIERNITWWSGSCSGIDDLYTAKSSGNLKQHRRIQSARSYLFTINLVLVNRN